MAGEKPAVHSPLALADIESAIDFYIVEAPHMVDHFVDALEQAATHIQRFPGTGSPRYAIELAIPGLRSWLLNKFPFGLFYMEQEDVLWIIRLVHMERDIPVSLQGDPPN